MTQEEKEFILFEFEPEFDESVSWLFGRDNIDGLFPVFFILYSYRHNLGLSFDDEGVMKYTPGVDELQDRLYEASLMVFGGDKEQFDYMEDTFDIVRSLDRELLDVEYPRLLDGLLCSTSLVAGTQMQPNSRIAVTAANILREHGCRTCLGAFSGVGVFALESAGMKYTGMESYAPANLIAEVLCDAFGVKKPELLNEDIMSRWTRRKFDGVIGNLPTDADFFNIYRADHYLHRFNEQQNEFVRKLLSRKTARKAAVFLSHFEFANYADYDDTRKMICDNGMLESVIALPEDLFKESLVPTYLVVLDMEGGRSEATFMDARDSLRRQTAFEHTIKQNRYDMRECVRPEEKVTVPYSEMEKVSWSFNPAVYLQDAVCSEGQELVRLGDIASVGYGKEDKELLTVGFASLSERFDRVNSGVIPQARGNDLMGFSVEGPSVLLSLARGSRDDNQKILCGVCRETGRYSVEFFLSVLKPDTEKVIPEYLALALMTDPSFAEYYKSAQEYYTDTVRWSHLLERRIPIIKDLVGQKKAVLDALGRADMSSMTYNVILAGSEDRMRRFRSLLPGYGCNVLAATGSIEGDGGLERILRDMSAKDTPVSKKADAIIADAEIPIKGGDADEGFEGLDAVLDLQILHRDLGLSLYVSSSCALDEIREKGKISDRRLKPVKDGCFYRTGDGKAAEEALAAALRSELDRKRSPEARIRSRYKDAFEAAEWLDENYADQEIHATETVSDFLMAAEEGVDTRRSLSDLRNVAHRIIEILKDCRAVPRLDNGAIPHLLYDMEYEDKKAKNGETYLQDIDIFNGRKPLASSLVALIDIGNEGTHTYRESANLGTAMLQTLLEFITWFYDRRDEFHQKTLTNYWHKLSEYEETWEEVTAPVEKHVVNGQTLWSCAGVHLFVDKNNTILPGDMVTVRKRIPDTCKVRIPGIVFLAMPISKERDGGYTIDRLTSGNCDPSEKKD